MCVRGRERREKRRGEGRGEGKEGEGRYYSEVIK
jgi:hypothetical protein